MSLRKLSDKDLVSSTHLVVQRERDSLQNVIEHFVEISRRSLHLAAGFGSLYSYLRQVYQYSESAAHRRVQAVRESIEIPEIQVAIQTGEINLSQIAELASAVKQSKTKVGKDQKRDLIRKISGKSGRDTQTILAQELNIELKTPETKKFQKDESVHLQITLTKEQFEKLEQCRDLFAATLSQNGKSTALSDVIEVMSDEILSKKTQPTKLKTPAAGVMPSDARTTEVRSAEVPLKKAPQKSMSPKLRQTIIQRDQCCQFQDVKTGKKCGSKFQLQVDHIQPRWADGDNDPQNLQALCAAHNNYRYREQSRMNFG